MVELTKRRYESTRGKRMQYVSANLDGKPLVYDTTAHIKLSAKVMKKEFTVTPVFTDETRMEKSGCHADVKPRVVIISGPVIQTGEYTFRYDPDYFGRDPRRLWSGITLSIEADGNDTYKSAVQELNIRIPE